MLERYQALGMLDRTLGLGDTEGLCTDPGFLAVVAQGRCRDNKLSVFVREPYLNAFNTDSERLRLEMVTDAVCETAAFLRSLANAVVRVRERVQAAIDERGGISTFERLTSSFGDGVVKRMAVVDGGLSALLPLVSSLDLQRQLVAGVARTMLQACRLQDDLRARVRSLGLGPSAPWRLEWDANSSTAVVTFVTFPEIDEVRLQIKAELARMNAERRRGWYHFSVLRSITGQLEKEMSDGWLQRLGLEPELPHLIENPNWFTYDT
jgi:hypothetical protein